MCLKVNSVTSACEKLLDTVYIVRMCKPNSKHGVKNANNFANSRRSHLLPIFKQSVSHNHPFSCQFILTPQLLTADVSDVSLRSALKSARSLRKCIWETIRGQLCVCVLRRWQPLGFSRRAMSLFHAAQTQPALQRGEHQSVSQSQGLKEKASPPPSLRRSLHTWTTRTLQEAYKASSRTCTGWAYFSFTLFAVLSASLVFIYDDPSADTISFSLNYISQLPILLSKNCFPSSLMLQFFFFLLQPVVEFMY